MKNDGRTIRVSLGTHVDITKSYGSSNIDLIDSRNRLVILHITPTMP